MERTKTISKIYWDDEIIGVTDTGDIVLKPRVRRQPKRSFDLEANEDEAQYWNYWVGYRDKSEKIQRQRDEENDWG